ncbi:hypothetical protein [Psychroflexus montanilacus]|uniref:hypothetical protein n=1 Tax=Psychroflexus montanilacus TaxID=2873598 RepID=UPI001CCD1316|nr:hypothetical protein [Psychroflexus montanilacus]MBZ9650916.1 hypothetical protein [Psychroflexus montanilacus]
MKIILRLFLTMSSVSFFLVVFLIQNDINPLKGQLGINDWVVHLGYALIPFITVFISLGICKLLPVSKVSQIKSINPSENNFLDNYFAFFFVALSVRGLTAFFVIFGLTIIFTFVSRVSYFNPVFLVFGYRFYYIESDERVKIMLISRKKILSPKTFESIPVRRINNYAYIDI